MHRADLFIADLEYTKKIFFKLMVDDVLEYILKIIENKYKMKIKK